MTLTSAITRKGRWICLLSSVALAASSAAPALAQDIRGQSVRDRLPPEFSKPPIIVGGFEVRPLIETELEYIDNIFASSTNPQDDLVISVLPSVEVRDRRDDREISLRARAGGEAYLNGTLPALFVLSSRGIARLRLGSPTRPFGGFGIDLNGSQLRGVDSDDFRFIAQPVRLANYRFNAGVEQDIGRFTVTGEGRANLVRYSGSLNLDGTEFDSGFRDYNAYVGQVDFSYTDLAEQRIYASASFNRREYGSADPTSLITAFSRDRSSDGYTIEAGYSRWLTDLFYVDARVGYLEQNYDDLTIASQSGLSLNAVGRYSPTALTTFTATARRTIDQTANPLFSGLLRTEFSLRADHELRRFLLVYADARYGRIDRGDLVEGSDEYNISAGLEYRVSPSWSLTGRAERYQRFGSFEFEQNRLVVGAEYRF